MIVFPVSYQSATTRERVGGGVSPGGGVQAGRGLRGGVPPPGPGAQRHLPAAEETQAVCCVTLRGY